MGLFRVTCNLNMCTEKNESILIACKTEKLAVREVVKQLIARGYFCVVPVKIEK